MTQNQMITALPPRARSIMYLIWSLGSLSLGAGQVGFSTAEITQPVWLSVSIAVWAFVGAGLGLAAMSNVNVGAPEVRDPEIIAAMGDDVEAQIRFQALTLGGDETPTGVDPAQVETAARRAVESTTT